MLPSDYEPPSEAPTDVFEHIDEWRADFDEDWFTRFSRCVMAVMITAIVIFALAVIWQ